MTPAPLSPMQANIAALCRRGMTLKEIAEHLGITYRQAKDHLNRVRRKGYAVKVNPSSRSCYKNTGKWKVTAPKGTRWEARAGFISVTADTRGEAMRTCWELAAMRAARTGDPVPTVKVEAV